ncbi:MAG: cytochrome C oxidase subunit IV family protein [Acidobacteria bacterium]|nr:cytochrome C oxidase subunit IV family protein [Acidobacteriota bacterium]
MAEHKSHGVSIYYKVFVALMVLTVVTVAVNRVHVGISAAIIVALMIAAFKGSLVAGYFMHLFNESNQIYRVLLLTAIFLIFLMFLPLLGRWSTVTGLQHRTPLTPSAAPAAESQH